MSKHMRMYVHMCTCVWVRVFYHLIESYIVLIFLYYLTLVGWLDVLHLMKVNLSKHFICSINVFISRISFLAFPFFLFYFLWFLALFLNYHHIGSIQIQIQIHLQTIISVSVSVSVYFLKNFLSTDVNKENIFFFFYLVSYLIFFFFSFLWN